MIVANLATYPPRRSNLLPVVTAIAPQVDRLNVVLNEYRENLPELDGIPNVVQILPGNDIKDVGKFYPDTRDADFVLLIDDDLVFPSDYVASTVSAFGALGSASFVGGYHGSLYVKPRFSLRPRRFRRWLTYSEREVADFRLRVQVHEALNEPRIVDQVATNAAIVRGKDIPPYEFMRGSEKFVDVRFARWAFEHDMRPVLLPRRKNWIGHVAFEETIYRGFTCTNPPEVAEEIMTYAFRVPGRGECPEGITSRRRSSG